MAIVLDVARTAITGGEYNTDMQTGNDNPNTPDATWLTCLAYAVPVVETHVTARADLTR